MNKELAPLIKNARIAQTELARYDQKAIDKLVRAAGKAVYDHAKELAADAVAETQMGNVADKTLKNQGKSKNVWNHLKHQKSVGIISPRDDSGMITIAKPVGVVGAVTPTTSPTMTIMCNVMFALKGGNTVVIAPHPRSKEVSKKTVQIINDSLQKCGAPPNLVQIIEQPSIDLTNELMGAVDVLVATGGPAMVRAAYSSGKPSFGVGAGNVQTILDSDIDLDDATKKIVLGRAFDNGLICSGDQSVIGPQLNQKELIASFEKNGAFYIGEKETVNRLRQLIFDGEFTSAEVIGKDAQHIARLLDLKIPKSTKVLLARSDGSDSDPLRSEKMCPVLALFSYRDLDDAIRIAQRNLETRGRGHTCVIHSNNDEHIAKIGLALPVSRIAINEPGSLSVGGALHNGFVPTATLGCGSWGNNSISENFSFNHMINTQRIGYADRSKKIPTDDTIWG